MIGPNDPSLIATLSRQFEEWARPILKLEHSPGWHAPTGGFRDESEWERFEWERYEDETTKAAWFAFRYGNRVATRYWKPMYGKAVVRHCDISDLTLEAIASEIENATGPNNEWLKSPQYVCDAILNRLFALEELTPQELDLANERAYDARVRKGTVAYREAWAVGRTRPEPAPERKNE
jgi:hypothetical protein